MRWGRIALCASLLGFGATLPASADEQRSWYAGVQFEANETDFSGIITATSLCGLLGLTPCPVVGDEISKTSDTGYGVLATLGARLGHFRIEGEVGYRTSDATQYATLSQTTAMLNGLFDLPVSDSITLSVGGGVGLDFVSWDHNNTDADDSSLAYQGIAEISFALTDNIDLSIDYRYLAAGDITLEGVTMAFDPTHTVAVDVDELDTQSLSIGVRFAL